MIGSMPGANFETHIRQPRAVYTERDCVAFERVYNSDLVCNVLRRINLPRRFTVLTLPLDVVSHLQGHPWFAQSNDKVSGLWG